MRIFPTQNTMGESAEVDLGSVDVVSSTSSSIHLAWTTVGDSDKMVEGFQIHYQKVASEYIQYSGTLQPKIRSYNINDLIADTYYKVCVFMFRNDTQPAKQCIDTSTASWHIPVSIGSSIGAVLALSIIVMVVLLSRCPSLMKRRRKSQTESGKYDSMSSQYQEHDHYEFSDVTGHNHDDEGFSEQEEATSADGSIRLKRLKQARSFDETETDRHAPPVCNGHHTHLSFNRASLPPRRDHYRMPVKQLSMQAECTSTMSSHPHPLVTSTMPKSDQASKPEHVTVHRSERSNSLSKTSQTGTI